VEACSDEWAAASGAKIMPDGVTFRVRQMGANETGNAVVTSQKGVEAISVHNNAVSGSAQIGLAQDASPNFDNGQNTVLPYKGNGAKDNDIITVASQGGHAKLLLNDVEVQDLGKVGGILLAKVILDQDQDSSVRVDGVVMSAPDPLWGAAVPKQTVPSWIFSAAMAAASVSMMAAVAWHRSRPMAGVEQPLLQQQ